MLKPRIFWPFTTAEIGNYKWIDVKNVSSGVTYSVDVSTAAAGLGLLALFQKICQLIVSTALVAAGEQLNCRLTNVVSGVGNPYIGFALSNMGDAIDILNATGPNAANNFLKHFFGCTADMTISGGYNFVWGTAQPAALFYSPVAVAYDSEDEFDVPNDGATLSVSGKMKYLSENQQTIRQVKLAFLPPEATRSAKVTPPTRTLEDLWRNGRSSFDYWNDSDIVVEGAASSTTLLDYSPAATAAQHGIYCLDHDTVLNGFHPTRLSTKELYTWQMNMRRIS